MAFNEIEHLSFEDSVEINIEFYSTPDHSPRPFEIVVHSFMQACEEMGMLEGHVAPLGQMRSANKKHGNVGDVEVIQGDVIIESWDVKYGKTYLADELLELEDKLKLNSSVCTAGFVTDGTPRIDDRCECMMQAFQDTMDVDVSILQFEEWTNAKIATLELGKRDEFAMRWVNATVESLVGLRPDKVSIDEPSEKWIEELTSILHRTSNNCRYGLTHPTPKPA